VPALRPLPLGDHSLLGRDSEMDQLRQALNQAGAGHGQVVAVIGEAVWASLDFTGSSSIRIGLRAGWSRSGSVSFGKASAYLPVSDLLRLLPIEPRDASRTVREKVTGKAAF
jgi:adenylate cyclase